MMLTYSLLCRNIRQYRRLNKKQQTAIVAASSNTKQSTAENGSGDASNPAPANNGAFKGLGEDIDIMDNTECKFKVNSFRMFYVVNSESYLYKRMALQRAKEVSQGGGLGGRLSINMSPYQYGDSHYNDKTVSHDP